MPDFNHYNNAISERIFILSIHEQKAKGNLKGNTSEEQYDYYEKTYLNNATYVKSLLHGNISGIFKTTIRKRRK